MKKYLSLGWILLVLGGFTSDTKGQLTIYIKNYSQVVGQMMISIYNQPEGFPGNVEKAYAKYKIPVKGKEFKCVINDLPFGKYGVAVIHDENGDGKLETNFLGMPKEGLGTSNNPKIRFGPPKYNEAEFNFNQNSQSITIELIHL